MMNNVKSFKTFKLITTVLISLFGVVNVTTSSFAATPEYYWSYGSGYVTQDGWDKVKANTPTIVNLKPYQEDASDIDNNTYPWTVDVITNDTSDKSVVWDPAQSSSPRHVTLTTNASAIKEIKLSTKAFSSFKILSIALGYNQSIDKGYSFSITNGTYSRTESAKSLSQANQYISATLDNINSQANELEIVFTNLFQDRINSLSLYTLQIIYTDGVKLKEAELSLPLVNNYQWSSSIVWDGPLFNTSVGKDNFEVLVTPLFDLDNATEPQNPDSHTEQSNVDDSTVSTPVDGYYSFEPSAKLTDEGGMSLAVPCSGLYEVTLRSKDNANGVKAASISRTYNIHCSYQGLWINWQRVPEDSTPFEIVIYYGNPPIWLGLDAKNVEIWYNVWNSLMSVTMLAAADESFDSIPDIPDNFSRYGAKGLPLIGNDFLEIYVKKNGSIAPSKIINYGTHINPVSVESIDADIDSEEAKEYYTLTGLPVAAETLTNGIYLERNRLTGETRKINFHN